MITSAVFIVLIGTFQFKTTISAAISYEPIQITVNENFNAQPGQVSKEFQSLEPGVVHQGANFYFKPRFNLPSTSISHHLEALMSLIQQNHSCAKDATKVVFEKDKLMEILMPFLYPKEALTDTVMEEENNSVIVEPVPILITEESKPAIPDLEVIPELPVLSPLPLNDIPAIVEEEVKKEESVILEESTSVLNEVPPKPATLELVIIPEAPVLPPLSANDIHIMEEVKVEEPITLTRPEPIVVDVAPKSATANLLVIPEAPVLPALTFNGMPSIFEEEVKKEDSVILEESTDLFPTKPAITVGSITEPINTYVEPKPSTSRLLVIPEVPVLPSLSFNGMPSFVEKEVKKEESIILEKSTDEAQETTIIEVEPKTATPEVVIIPEAPILPTLSANDIRIVEKVNIEEPITLPTPDTIFVDFEPKPKTSELVVIPEAPVLPPLSYNDIRTFVEEEMEKKQSIILEESKGVSQEPTTVEIEPKPATPELEVIPEAPVLPPLSFNGIPASVEEELKKEDLVLSKESAGVSQAPTLIEIEPKPTTPELVLIPEAPVLPPFSANDIHVVEEVKIEPKSVASELLVIPEAPIMPPLSFNGISAFVQEEVKKEESVIPEKPTGVLQEPTFIELKPKPATPELVIIPGVQQSLSFEDIRTFVEEEIKNKESGLPGESKFNHITIPEAPVLPPLSYNDIRTFVEEEMEKKQSIILEDSKGVSQEPTIVEIEPKPATPELEVIPEAPVLPPLLVNGIPDFVVEEVKKEESVLLEETTGLFPESTIIEVEPKNATPQPIVIPEAPVLPPLTLNHMSQFVEKELKKEESIILEESQEPIMIEIEPKPATPELIIMPEAPVFAPLSANNIRTVEEMKIEEPTTLPTPESIVVDFEPKPVNPAAPEMFAIPEAPMLPPLSFNGFPFVVEAEVKKEESVILEESTGLLQDPTIIEMKPRPATPELAVIPEAPVLPPISVPVVEEAKSDESILLEESTGSIPEISARPTLESFVETETAESLENNIFPVATEEIKIEIPILLEESIEVFPPIAEISSGPTLQEPEITNSYVLEEVSQPNSDCAATAKETLPPTIIRKPSNNLGVFSYAPFLSHLSSRAPKAKKLMFPKPASLERFLFKKHPFRLPVTPFPKLSLNEMNSPILGNKNHFLYPTSYAHDVVE